MEAACCRYQYRSVTCRPSACIVSGKQKQKKYDRSLGRPEANQWNNLLLSSIFFRSFVRFALFHSFSFARQLATHFPLPHSAIHKFNNVPLANRKKRTKRSNTSWTRSIRINSDRQMKTEKTNTHTTATTARASWPYDWWCVQKSCGKILYYVCEMWMFKNTTEWLTPAPRTHLSCSRSNGWRREALKNKHTHSNSLMDDACAYAPIRCTIKFQCILVRYVSV